MTAAEPRTEDPREPAEDAGGVAQQRPLIALVVSLFFAWGFCTVLVDSLVPKLKGLFALSYTEVMLTQFSFFLGYLFFSIPSGLLLSRVGYMRSTVFGLAVMASGCLLFSPAAAIGSFPAFLSWIPSFQQRWNAIDPFIHVGAAAGSKHDDRVLIRSGHLDRKSVV